MKGRRGQNRSYQNRISKSKRLKVDDVRFKLHDNEKKKIYKKRVENVIVTF